MGRGRSHTHNPLTYMIVSSFYDPLSVYSIRFVLQSKFKGSVCEFSSLLFFLSPRLTFRSFLWITRSSSSSREDPQACVISQKNYDLCVQAANHITSVVATYKDNYCIKRAPVFLSYYVFTASVMHVTTRASHFHQSVFDVCIVTEAISLLVNAYPDDPQARMGLIACMDVLKALEIVWPSAGRAWELLRGSNVNLGSAANASPDLASSSPSGSRPKRTAEHFLEDSHFFAGVPVPGSGPRASGGGPGPGANQGFPLTAISAATGNPNSSNPNITTNHNPHGPGSHSSGSNGSYYPSSYDRWPGDGGLSTFPASLSTSVLPQQYSTGFVDDHRARAASADSGGGASGSQRYPQYWSDYSSLGSLSTSFGVPMLPPESLQQTQQHQQGQGQNQTQNHQGGQDKIYVPEQYQHMFGELNCSAAVTCNSYNEIIRM